VPSFAKEAKLGQPQVIWWPAKLGQPPSCDIQPSHPQAHSTIMVEAVTIGTRQSVGPETAHSKDLDI
jgi:hypothetical protein